MLTGLISVRCNQPSVFFPFSFSLVSTFSTISFNMLFTVGPMLLGILPVLISTINKVYNKVIRVNVVGNAQRCAGCRSQCQNAIRSRKTSGVAAE